MFKIKEAIIIKEHAPKVSVLSISKEVSLELEKDIEEYFNGKLKLHAFIEKYGCQPLHIIMFGESMNITSTELRGYIQYSDVSHDGVKFRKSYKCFCGEKFGLNHKETILHGSPLDSWRCLLTSLGNPEYVALFHMTNLENDYSVMSYLNKQEDDSKT